jgi:hypothetical protein
VWGRGETLVPLLATAFYNTKFWRYTVPKAFLTHEKFHGSTGKVSSTTMKYSALSNFPYYREMYGKMFMLFPFMHNIKTMKNFPYVRDVFHAFSEVFMVVRGKKA